MTFRLKPEAETDIEAIALHIAKDDPSAALRWFDAIHQRCRNLGEMPGLGVAKPRVRKGLRMFPMGDYLILYRKIPGGAEIVRVVHGARRWRGLV